MKRLLYGTTTAQGNDTTSGTNALVVRNSAGNVLLGITNDGAVRVGTNASATTQTTASINASGSGTNIGLALVPKGTGAITANIPDGTTTGGNARGASAIDFQIARTAATQVASGTNAIILGGSNNTASGTGAIIIGGGTSSASGAGSVVIGGSSSVAQGLNSFASGSTAYATADNGIAFGAVSFAYLHGQFAVSSGSFGTLGAAQSSSIRFRRIIAGTAKTELFLDGSGIRAQISGLSNITSRIWNATIQVIAVCQTQGNGTVTAGEVFGGNYAAIIKRIGNTTSLVGTVQNLHTAQTDTNMATAVVDITADDTNEALKIEFTPPTTAGSTTVIRVVATVYLTEVGY